MTRQSLRAAARLPDRAHRRGRPSRGGPRWLTVAAYLGLGLLCLGAAAVTFAVVAPPLDEVRDRLVRQVQERTGRTLAIAGPMSIALLPRPVVTLRDIALLPPGGMAGGPTVSVPALDAEIGFWSLLSRRPRLGQLTLHRPVVDLVVDGQGRRSWDARPKPRASAAPKAPAPAVSAEAPAPASARRRKRRPLVVRVAGGTVRYRDERTGAAHEITALDLDLATDTPAAALIATGSFAWQGEPFRFSASADAAVVIKVSGAPLEATYEGSLAVEGGVAAEGTLSLAHLAYKGAKLGPAKLALAIAAGAADLTLEEVALYGGRGQGRLRIDAAGVVPALSATVKLADVALLPLLKDWAGAAWLDGRGALTLALAGQGATERQIAESLKGEGQLTVADGTVTGFDVERILGAIQRARLDRLAPRRQDRTPFSALTGSFAIGDGVASTRDLKLVSKRVELKGEGRIELVPRRVDATLQMRLDGGAPADGAVVSIGTVELPIGIKGPLDRPEFSLKGQEALSDAIGRIGRNLKSREVKEVIDGLIGGDRTKRVKPGELLEKLLKKE